MPFTPEAPPVRQQLSQESGNGVDYLRRDPQLLRQRLTVPWLVRLCLTAPIQSARAFANVHADLTGTADSRGCSRKTIDRIRCAFVQVCLKGGKAEIQDLVERIYHEGVDSPGRPAAASSASLAPGQICGSGSRQVHGSETRQSNATGVRFVVLLHVQDEAKLRLRAQRPPPGPPSYPPPQGPGPHAKGSSAHGAASSSWD